MTSPREQLSPKEIIVATMVWEGLTNPQIAIILGSTEQVVKNQLRGVFDKLGVWSRLELAIYIASRGGAEQSWQPARRARRLLRRRRKFRQGDFAASRLCTCLDQSRFSLARDPPTRTCGGERAARDPARSALVRRPVRARQHTRRGPQTRCAGGLPRSGAAGAAQPTVPVSAWARPGCARRIIARVGIAFPDLKQAKISSGAKRR